MKRGDFVRDLLNLWEDAVRKLKREGNQRAAKEVETAISVLEKTYTSDELEVTAA